MFATTGSGVTVGTMFSFFFLRKKKKIQLGTGIHLTVSLVAPTWFRIFSALPPKSLVFFLLVQQKYFQVYTEFFFPFCLFIFSTSVGGKGVFFPFFGLSAVLV